MHSANLKVNKIVPLVVLLAACQTTPIDGEVAHQTERSSSLAQATTSVPANIGFNEAFSRGKHLYKQRNYTEAHAFLEKSVNLSIQQHGEDHTKSFNSRIWLVTNLLKMNRIGEAVRTLNYLQPRVERKFGENSRPYASVLIALSEAEGRRGNWHLALDHASLALKIRTSVVGAKHPVTAQAHHLIAIAKGALGSYQSAEAHVERAMSIFQGAHIPESDGRVQAARRLLIRVKERQGKFR